MTKQINNHGPGCRFCVHEESRIIRAGFCGYVNHRYCSNKKPCKKEKKLLLPIGGG
jgi:hypothetical protein